jgi:hypothetical protein
MLDRGLALHRAKYPDAPLVRDRALKRFRQPGEHADPHTGSGKRPCLESAGQHYNQRVAGRLRRGTSERRVSLNEVLSGCHKVLQNRVQQGMGWWRDVQGQVGSDNEKILDCCKVVVFHRCRSKHCLFSSSLSAQLLAREGKSGASSYCFVKTTSVRGESATVPAFIRYFMLVQWLNTERTVDRLARVNMIDISQANERECELDEFVFGSKVYRFDPLTDMRDGND